MNESLILREQFEDARCEAVTLTDQYHALAIADPKRALMWDHAMQQTEAARRLLEAWLDAEQPINSSRERLLALA
jgi:hypothetical protein